MKTLGKSIRTVGWCIMVLAAAVAAPFVYLGAYLEEKYG